MVVPSTGLALANGIHMLRGPFPQWQMVRGNAASWVKRVGLSLFGPFLVPHIRFQPLFLLKPSCIVAARQRGGSVSLAYLGGVTGAADVLEVWRTGHFAAVAVARALLRDPAWPRRVDAEFAWWSERVDAAETGNPSAAPSDIEDSAVACCHCNSCIVAQMTSAPLRCVKR